MKSLRELAKDTSGLAGSYLRIIISLIIVSLCWIVLQEFVLRIYNATSAVSTDPNFAGTSSLLMYMFRALPVVLFISAIMWGIWIAHREPPSYGGG